MWELDCEEGWAPKNWCFWTVVLEKTLESPLDSKDIQPVHSEGDHPGISLEGMMLKLKLQYFGHLMWRVDSLEKTLMLGGIGGRRRRGWQRMRWLHGITDTMDIKKPWEIVKDRELVCCSPQNCTVQFSSVAQSCPTLCDPMNCSMAGFPVHHQLLEFTQTHVHWIGDAIQSCHLLSSPSPPALNPSQHQSLFQWVNFLHEVAKVLEFRF